MKGRGGRTDDEEEKVRERREGIGKKIWRELERKGGREGAERKWCRGSWVQAGLGQEKLTELCFYVLCV